MYKSAYAYNDEVVFYFDTAGNKYVASGGSLAWRLNNPGLVRSHSIFSRSQDGAIGSFGSYAIFSFPEKGRKALKAWIQSKKYFNHSLKRLAKHYQSQDTSTFLSRLTSLSGMSPDIKIRELGPKDLDRLLMSIEKLCGYTSTGNEQFSLLPKITAKIENGKDLGETYLVGDNIALSKKEAMDWIQEHRLDAVIVHARDGTVHLRSRPRHCLQYIKIQEPKILYSIGEIGTLVRTVGRTKPNHCIWGFINGINNTKKEALESAELISRIAGGDCVFSMPNDTVLRGVKDVLVCLSLKLANDPPIVQWAAKFFQYLLSLSEKNEAHSPVVIFAHSQGAIIAEHALRLMDKNERERLRIFTFGGGSFIAPGACHPDSHNYASAADFVCRLGSPNLQYLALQRYFGGKEGHDEKKVSLQLAVNDALFDLDSADTKAIELYTEQRVQYYEKEFDKISNVTILDPDPKWRHKFNSSCYQDAVQAIVKKYRHS